MSADSGRGSGAGGAAATGSPLVVAGRAASSSEASGLLGAVHGLSGLGGLLGETTNGEREAAQWARFEATADGEPLLAVGYARGVQVWRVPPLGDAREVLSWRQGTVRLLRFLPSPRPAERDPHAAARPLVALCDSAGPGPPFCSLSFISLRTGDQVKSIKFKNPVLDAAANERSIVVAFSERLAVFDARTLEDRLTVTSCYPSPCPLGGPAPANPIALGDRWLAYAENELIPHKRSSGGCLGEGASSYTAAVLHAAKSLGAGLRGLGESVASSLAGRPGAPSPVASPSPPRPHSRADRRQPGIVTVLDIEKSPDEDAQDGCEESYDPMVAHFPAHSDAIVALEFDASGMLLMTADRRGHDFHVFRIHPHLSGPSLASAHHLYVLRRGDTTAKVQDMRLSVDARWACACTLRGTVHVYALAPYGGPAGLRTHASPRVVNRASRFRRSAGLCEAADGPGRRPAEAAAADGGTGWFPNPRLPPYPAPTVVRPLAQLRPSPDGPAVVPTNTITRNSSGRQRLSSLSEEGPPLWVRASWAQAEGGAPGATALLVACAQGLLHYALSPRAAARLPRDRLCDESPLELDAEAVRRWDLARPPRSPDLAPPLPASNPLLRVRRPRKDHYESNGPEEEDGWLSQVEIVTHAGPHRRLWMGPQFVFKTYNAANGSSLSLLDAEAVEVGAGAVRAGARRSSPVDIRHAGAAHRPALPVYVDSGSASSLEHSPRMSDAYRKPFSADGGDDAVAPTDAPADAHRPPPHGDVRLKEDLAEAMKESDRGRAPSGGERETERAPGRLVRRVVNPLGTVARGDSDDGSPPDGADRRADAGFRPVAAAAATLIPARRVFAPPDGPRAEPAPLDTRVRIPAALSAPPRAPSPAPAADADAPPAPAARRPAAGAALERRSPSPAPAPAPADADALAAELPSPSKRKFDKIDAPGRDDDFETVKGEERVGRAPPPDAKEPTPERSTDGGRNRGNRRNRKNKPKMRPEVAVEPEETDVDPAEAEEWQATGEPRPEAAAAAEAPAKLSWSSIVERPSKNPQPARGAQADPPAAKADPSATLYNLDDVVMATCDVPSEELRSLEEFEEPPPLEPLDFTFEDKYSDDGPFEIEREIEIDLFVGSNETVDESIDSVHSAKRICDDNDTADSYSDILKSKSMEMTDVDCSEGEFKSSDLFIKADLALATVARSENDAEKAFDSVNVMDKSSDEENVSPSSSQTESDDYFPHLTSVPSEELVRTEASETLVSATATIALQKSNKKKSKRKRR